MAKKTVLILLLLVLLVTVSPVPVAKAGRLLRADVSEEPPTSSSLVAGKLNDHSILSPIGYLPFGPRPDPPPAPETAEEKNGRVANKVSTASLVLGVVNLVGGIAAYLFQHFRKGRQIEQLGRDIADTKLELADTRLDLAEIKLELLALKTASAAASPSDQQPPE